MDDEVLKTYLNISKNIKKKFTTQKSLLSFGEKIDSLINLVKDEENIEFTTILSNCKAKCHSVTNRKDLECEVNIECGRKLFEKCVSDISHGYTVTFDSYVDAISYYDKAIQYMKDRNSYLSGSLNYEMACYLKKILKFNDSYTYYINAGNIFGDYFDLKSVCYWEAICCLIYTNQFYRASFMLEEFKNIKHTHTPFVIREARILSALLDALLNPNVINTSKLSNDEDLDLWESERDTTLRILIESIKVAYAEGNIKIFREIEDHLIPLISLEQHYLINEMRYRCDNPSSLHLM